MAAYLALRREAERRPESGNDAVLAAGRQHQRRFDAAEANAWEALTAP